MEDGHGPEALHEHMRFQLLVAAGGVIVGVVGKGPWPGAACGLVAIAAEGAAVLRRRVDADSMSWHE